MRLLNIYLLHRKVIIAQIAKTVKLRRWRGLEGLHNGDYLATLMTVEIVRILEVSVFGMDLVVLIPVHISIAIHHQ